MNKMMVYIFLCLLTGLAACDDNNSSNPASGKLEPVFMDSTYQFTGIAKVNGGPLYITYPRWSFVYRYAAVTAQGTTGVAPYPDSATNKWMPGEPGLNKWVCVQTMFVDDAGDVWVLDPAAPMLKSIQGNGAKLVKMNKTTNTPARIYPLGSAITDTSYANDVRIDTRRQYAYMTDSKSGGIIVLDLTSGRVREVLRAHPSTISDPSYKFIIDGRELMKDGKPAKFNSDGIALTPDGDWLYYKPLSDDKLYRIRTEYLRDTTMTNAALGAKVEDLGHFNTTDGMIFDSAGNLYMGDLQNYAIIKLDKDLKKTVLVQNQQLIWPDTYSIADGYLYITCSQINKQSEYNNDVNKRTTPYMVYRLKL